jgi:hypothetical protein
MTPLPPSDLRARILAQAKSEPAPTMAIRRSGVILAAAVGALWSLAFALLFGLPRTRPTATLLTLAVGGGLFALGAAWVAADRGRSMLGRPQGALTAVAVVAPFGILAIAMAVAAIGIGVAPGSVVFAGGTTAQHLTCAIVTVLFALGPFLAFAYARRGSDPVHPRVLGAALGAAAGAWGGAMIDVHCTLTTVEHLALGHSLPVVFLTAVGALLGGRVFGVRARS